MYIGRHDLNLNKIESAALTKDLPCVKPESKCICVCLPCVVSTRFCLCFVYNYLCMYYVMSISEGACA